MIEKKMWFFEKKIISKKLFEFLLSNDFYFYFYFSVKVNLKIQIKSALFFVAIKVRWLKATPS